MPSWKVPCRLATTIAVCVDITERKRAEEALRNSEEHLRMVSETGEQPRAWAGRHLHPGPAPACLRRGEPRHRLVLTMLLAQMGHQVESAASMREALSALPEADPKADDSP